MTTTLTDTDWKILVRRIRDGRCLPFLGAGAAADVLPLGRDVAYEWATRHEYPLQDAHDLARVAQYLSVNYDNVYPKDLIAEKLRDAPYPDFSRTDEPHGTLARLPFPIYLTTNYDDFMMKALTHHGRKPRREYCRWNAFVQELPSVLDDGPFELPSSDQPLVFHLHGHLEILESLVITEDDYLEFLVRMTKYKDLIPMRIQRLWASSSMLFIGYSITDWTFRVLFRGLADFLGRNNARQHVSVQIGPSRDKDLAEQERAKRYLERYYSDLNIKMYWGTARDFVSELSEHWEAASHGT